MSFNPENSSYGEYLQERKQRRTEILTSALHDAVKSIGNRPEITEDDFVQVVIDNVYNATQGNEDTSREMSNIVKDFNLKGGVEVREVLRAIRRGDDPELSVKDFFLDDDVSQLIDTAL